MTTCVKIQDLVHRCLGHLVRVGRPVHFKTWLDLEQKTNFYISSVLHTWNIFKTSQLFIYSAIILTNWRTGKTPNAKQLHFNLLFGITYCRYRYCVFIQYTLFSSWGVDGYHSCWMKLDWNIWEEVGVIFHPCNMLEVKVWILWD